MNSTKLARRTGLLAARAILGTATAKFQVVAVATGAGITALLFMFGMVAVAYQTATTAQASEIGQQDIPPVALLAYQQAAEGACDGLHWSILAGIGKVETDHGRHGGAQLLPNGDTNPLILGPVLDGSGVGGNLTPLPVGPWRGQWGLNRPGGPRPHAVPPRHLRPLRPEPRRHTPQHPRRHTGSRRLPVRRGHH